MSKSTDSESFLPPSASTSDSTRRPLSCLFVSVLLSVIINIVIVIVFLVLVVFKPSHSPTIAPETGTVCFDCNHFGSGIKSSDTLYNVYRTENHTICCLKEDGDLNKAFKKIIIDEQNRDCNKSSPTERFESYVFSRLRHNRTGAHLYLDPRALNDGELSWTDQDSYNSSYTLGVEYKARALHIPTPGQYLVYSNIKYKRKYPQTHGGSNFVHSIKRFHPRQPNLGTIDILVSRNSYPKYNPHRYSFLSAVLKLRKNDQLTVVVSDTDSVHDHSMSSYFGVIKI